jgi:hypothetical protein
MIVGCLVFARRFAERFRPRPSACPSPSAIRTRSEN